MPNQNSRDQTPVIVGKAYDLNLWLLQKAEKFPRSYRYILGDRLADCSLELLLALVEAAYARDKAPALERAGTKVNAVRYLLRTAKDLRLISEKAYAHVRNAWMKSDE